MASAAAEERWRAGRAGFRNRLREFCDHWQPYHGSLPHSLSFTIHFERDCWPKGPPEKGVCFYTEIKGSRILVLGPFEVWLEL